MHGTTTQEWETTTAGRPPRPADRFHDQLVREAQDKQDPIFSVAGIHAGGWRGFFLSFLRLLIVYLVLMTTVIRWHDAQYEDWTSPVLALLVLSWIIGSYLHAGSNFLKLAGWLKTAPFVALVCYGIWHTQYYLS